MKLAKQIYLFGIGYLTAPATAHEDLEFDSEAAGQLLRITATRHPAVESVILTTSKRTEFYLASNQGPHMIEEWINCLKAFRPGTPLLRDDCYRYELNGRDAIEHLYKLAAGLDASLLGDINILDQIKTSLRTARQASSLGKHLLHIFSQAIQVGQQCLNETGIERVETLIETAVGLWEQWLSRQGLERAIKTLYLDADQMSDEVVQSLVDRSLLPAEEADQLIRRAFKQVLHGHVTRLRAMDSI